MNKDRYPELGPRQRANSFEDCLARVRAVYADVFVEGSTGAERTFWIRVGQDKQLVAHAWPVSRVPDSMWLRIFPVGQLAGRIFL